MIKVLIISYTDEKEKKFNNLDLADSFPRHGVNLSYLVWIKESDSPKVKQFIPKVIARLILAVSRRINFYFSRQNRHQFWVYSLLLRPIFWKSDVIHLHLIENGWFEIRLVRLISYLKPTIWTWHDLWPVTGHCIQPVKCENWLNACSTCPQLNSPFPVAFDRTFKERATKANLWEKSQFKIHVSTEWMEMQIRRALPSLVGRVRVIPFGLKSYGTLNNKLYARSKLKISMDDLVVGVRGSDSLPKGTIDFANFLKSNPTIAREVTLIDFDSSGLFNEIELKDLITYSWRTQEEIEDILIASDVFVVPSYAESFGILAVQAQLLGCLVVARSSTALLETLGGEARALYFSRKIDTELAGILQSLINGEEYLEVRDRAKRWSSSQYSSDVYLRKMTAYYGEILSEKSPRFFRKKITYLDD